MTVRRAAQPRPTTPDVAADYPELARLLGFPFARPSPRKRGRPKRRGPALAYQLKVTLKGSKPPIWRRLLVRSDTPLPDLTDVLLAAMGWHGYHLHQFVVDGENIGVPDDVGWIEITDEGTLRLDQIASEAGSRFVFEYDFGDGWEHQVLLEKVLPLEPDGVYPRCITGRRACPPEDVGGIWGYAGFLEALRDPAHPEHGEHREWIGGSFDPENFNLEGANARLRPRGRDPHRTP